MDRAQRIAHKHNVAIAPVSIGHDLKVNPVWLVRQERVSFQVVPEDLLAVGTALRLRHLCKTGGFPRLCVALNDEGAGGLAVGVAVSDIRAAAITAEDERET